MESFDVSQKSSKDKEYQETLEFVSQLKPLKERWRSDLMKNKLAALSSPTAKKVPHKLDSIKSPPCRIDYTSFYKVRGSKQTQAYHMRSSSYNLNSPGSLEENQTIRQNLPEASFSISRSQKGNSWLYSPEVLKKNLSLMKLNKNAEDADESVLIKPKLSTKNLKLQSLSISHHQNFDFSKNLSASAVVSPQTSSPKESFSSKDFQSFSKQNITSPMRKTFFERSPTLISSKSSVFLHNKKKKEEQMDVSQIEDKEEQKVQQDNEEKSQHKVYTQMQKLHIAPKELLNLTIDIDIPKEEAYKQLDFKNNYIMGQSRWHTQDGRQVWKRCHLLGYNSNTKKFLIEWEGTQARKEVYRKNLVFDFEHPEEYKKEIEIDLTLKKEALTQSHFRKLILSEAQQRKDLQFPRSLAEGIMKRLKKHVLVYVNSNRLEKAGIASRNKTAIQKYLEEVKKMYSFATELSAYNMKHKPEEYLLENILRRIKKSGQIEKPAYQDYQVIRALENDIVDELGSDKFQTLRIIDFVPKTGSAQEQIPNKIQQSDMFIKSFSSKKKWTLEENKHLITMQTKDTTEEEEREEEEKEAAIYSDQKVYHILETKRFTEVTMAIKTKSLMNIFNLKNENPDTLYNAFLHLLKSVEAVQEIDIFSLLTEKTLKHNNWEEIKKELSDNIERFDTEVYKIEKQFKDFAAALLASPCQLDEIQQKNSLDNCAKTLNLLIEENIKNAINFSISNLIKHMTSFTNFFQYYCYKGFSIERLPTLNDDILIHQTALTENLRILKTELKNGNLLKRNTIRTEAFLVKKPLFEINIYINEEHHKKEHEATSTSELNELEATKNRYEERNRRREIFYKEADDKGIRAALMFYLSTKDETYKRSYSVFVQNIKFNEITNDTLAWIIPNSKCVFKYKSSLEGTEAFLKQTIAVTLSKLFNYSKINFNRGCFVYYNSVVILVDGQSTEDKGDADEEVKNEPDKFKLFGMERELDISASKINNILLNAYYMPIAFLILIEPLGFYTQKLELIDKDIREFLKNESFTEVIGEFEAMRRDMETCAVYIPEEIECGIVRIKLPKVKKELVSTIEKNIEKLRKRCEEAFIKVVEELEKLYEETLVLMTPADKEIEDYIKLHDYLSDKAYHQALETLEKRAELAHKLYEILEQAMIKISFDLLVRYYQVSISGPELKSTAETLMSDLQRNKSRYEDQLTKEENHIKKKFHQFKAKMETFTSFEDMTEYFAISDHERIGVEEFNQLIQKGKKVNEYREKLELQKINMTEMSEYYSLWELCENLFFTQQMWESCLVIEIRLDDMKKLIEKREAVIDRALRFFNEQEYAPINALIQATQKSTNIIEEYHYILTLLQTEAFKESYWEQIIKKMWNDSTEIPPHTDIIFKSLITRDLIAHKDFIISLFQEASQENKLNLELSILSESIKDISFTFARLGTYQKTDINLLDNIISIRETLDDLLHNCGNFTVASKKYKLLTEKITKINLTLNLLSYFFEDLDKFQDVLVKIYPFSQKKEFLDQLDGHSKSTLHKIFSAEQEALMLVINNGIEDLHHMCENLLLREGKKNKNPSQLYKNFEKMFKFKEKIGLLTNLTNHVTRYLDTIRFQHPRLYFLEDYEIGEVLEVGTDYERYFKVMRKAFENLKEFKVSLESELDNTHQGVYITEQQSVSLGDCYLKGVINSNEEHLLLPKNLLFAKGQNLPFLNQLDNTIKSVLKLDILKAWSSFASQETDEPSCVYLLNLLRHQEICSQTLFIVNEAVFYFYLSGIVKLANSEHDEEANYKHLLECLANEKIQTIKELIIVKPWEISTSHSHFLSECKALLIQQENHFVEIIEALRRSDTLSDLKFEYLCLPKVYVDVPQTVYSCQDLIKLSLERLEDHKSYQYPKRNLIPGLLKGRTLNIQEIEAMSRLLKVSAECVHNTIEYGYELNQQRNGPFLYPISDHCLYQIATSMSHQMFPLLTNANPAYITLSLQGIASHFAKNVYAIDISQQKDNSLSNINFKRMSGAIANGGWIIASNLDCWEQTEFFRLAEILIRIKEAKFAKQKEIILENKTIPLNPDLMVLGISRPFGSDSKINGVLLEHYRPLHLEIPRFEHILSTLLYCVEDSQGSHLFASKISRLLNALTQHSEYKTSKLSEQGNLIHALIVMRIQEELIELKLIGSPLKKLNREVLKILMAFFRERDFSVQFLDDLEEMYRIFLGEMEQEAEQKSSESNTSEEDISKHLEEFSSSTGVYLEDYLKDFIYELYQNYKTKKPLILYGDSDENAWIAIRAWSYIHAQINNYNFCLIRLLIDSMDEQLLFGKKTALNSGFYGALNQLLQSMDNKYLKYFCKYPAIPNTKASLNPSFNAVILDSHHTRVNTQDAALVKNLLLSHCALLEPSSSNKALIFKLRDLHEVDLAQLCNLTLCHVPKKLFSIRMEHQKWVTNLLSLNRWFSHMVPELENLKNFILFPLFNKFLNTSKIVFPLNDHGLFQNFSCFLQIFLNELRKYASVTHATHSWYSAATHIDMEGYSEGRRTDRTHSLSSRKSSVFSILQIPQMDLTPQSPRVSSLIEKKKVLMHLQDMIQEHQMATVPQRKAGLEKQDDLICVLQCLYFQSLIAGIGNLLKDKHKKAFLAFLSHYVQLYFQSSSHSTSKTLLELLTSLSLSDSIFNYYYDFSSGQWKPFMEYMPLSEKCITSSFTAEELALNEKARFLAENREHLFREPRARSKMQCLHLTANKRKAYLLLDYLVCYDRNILLIGSPHQGKSLLLEYFAEKFESSKVTLNPETSKQQLAEKFSNLMSKAKSHSATSSSSTLVYIDDINLQNDQLNPLGIMKQIFQLNGAYSYTKHRFIEVSDIIFLLSATVSASSLDKTPMLDYFNYQDSPMPLYLDPEDNAYLHSVFQKQILSTDYEAYPSIQKFSAGLFEYLWQNQSIHSRFNAIFQTNLTLSAIFTLFHNLQLLHGKHYEDSDINQILKISLYTLFQFDIKVLNKYAMKIFGVGLIPSLFCAAFKAAETQQISSDSPRKKTSGLYEKILQTPSRRGSIEPVQIIDKTSEERRKSRLGEAQIKLSLHLVSEDSSPKSPNVNARTPIGFDNSARAGFYYEQTDQGKMQKAFFESYLKPNEGLKPSSGALYIQNSAHISKDPGIHEHTLRYFNKLEEYEEVLKEILIKLNVKTSQSYKEASESLAQQISLALQYHWRCNYLLDLLYMLQTFSSSSHLLILPHQNFLSIPQHDCVLALISLIDGVPHFIDSQQASLSSFSECLENILENLSHDENKTHFVLYHLQMQSNISITTQTLQDINSLAEHESFYGTLGAAQVSKILNAWRHLIQYKDYTDEQLLRHIQHVLINKLRIVILLTETPNLLGNKDNFRQRQLEFPSTIQKLKVSFPKLISNMFTINLSATARYLSENLPPLNKLNFNFANRDISLEYSFDTALQKILNIIRIQEGKLYKDTSGIFGSLDFDFKLAVFYELLGSLISYYSKPSAFLERKGFISNTLIDINEVDLSLLTGHCQKSSNETLNKLLLKCCMRARGLALGIKQPIFEEGFLRILTLSALYSVFFTQYPYNLKKKATGLTKKGFALDFSVPLVLLLKGEKYYQELYSKISNLFFLSDQVCEDLMTVNALIDHTNVPAIYIHDPLSLLSSSPSVMANLLSFGTAKNKSIFLNRKDLKDLASQSFQGKIIVIQDLTEEEYFLYVHQLLERLYEEYIENSMLHPKKNINEGSPKKTLGAQKTQKPRLIFLFNTRTNFFLKTRNLFTGVDLDIPNAKKAYKLCLKNMLTFGSNQAHQNLKGQEIIEDCDIKTNLKKITEEMSALLVDAIKSGETETFLKDKLQNLLNNFENMKENPDKLEEQKTGDKDENNSDNFGDASSEKTKQPEQFLHRRFPQIRKDFNFWSDLSEDIILIKSISTQLLKPSPFPEEAYLLLIKESLSQLPSSELKTKDPKPKILENVIKNVSQWFPSDSRQILHTLLAVLHLKEDSLENTSFWDAFLKDKYVNTFAQKDVSPIYDRLLAFLLSQGLRKTPQSQLLCLYESKESLSKHLEREEIEKVLLNAREEALNLETEKLLVAENDERNTADRKYFEKPSSKTIFFPQIMATVFAKRMRRGRDKSQKSPPQGAARPKVTIMPPADPLKTNKSVISMIQKVDNSQDLSKSQIVAPKSPSQETIKSGNGQKQSPLETLTEDFICSNVLVRRKARAPTARNQANLPHLASTHDHESDLYYKKYFEETTLWALQNITQKLPTSLARLLTTIQKTKVSELNALLLKDTASNLETPMGETFPPLGVLFLAKMLRPDFLKNYINKLSPKNLNSSFVNSKFLEQCLLENSKSLIIVDNSQVPQLYTTIQTFLKAHDVRNQVSLRKDFKFDTFISHIRSNKCAIFEDSLTINDIFELSNFMKSPQKAPSQSLSDLTKYSTGKFIVSLNKTHQSEIPKMLSQYVTSIYINPMYSIKEMMISLHLPEVIRGMKEKQGPSVSVSRADSRQKSTSKLTFTEFILCETLKEEVQRENKEITIKYENALQVALCVYYKRQNIRNTSDNYVENSLTLIEISRIKKEFKKISATYAISSQVLLHNLPIRILDSSLFEGYDNKENLLTMDYYVRQFSHSLAAMTSTTQPGIHYYPINHITKVYPLFSSQNPESLEPQDILQTLSRYPNEDNYDAICLDGGNKTHYDFECSNDLFLKLERVYKKLQEDNEGCQAIQEDYKEIWKAEKDEDRFSTRLGFVNIKKELDFIKGLYQVINAFEEISTSWKRNESHEKDPEDFKSKFLMVEKNPSDKQKMDLSPFGRKSKPSFTQTMNPDSITIEKEEEPFEQSKEGKWILDTLKNEIKMFNKLLRKLKENLLSMMTNKQKNLGESKWEDLLAHCIANQVPETWAKRLSVALKMRSLSDYLELLVLKYEFFDSLITRFKKAGNKRSQESAYVFMRSLDLQWFHHPVNLIDKYILWYCQTNHVDYDKLEFILVPIEKTEGSSGKKNKGLYLSGLKLFYGYYNMEEDELQEGAPLGIVQKLPELNLIIQERKKETKEKQTSTKNYNADIHMSVCKKKPLGGGKAHSLDQEKNLTGKRASVTGKNDEKEELLDFSYYKVRIEFREGNQVASACLLKPIKIVFYFYSKTPQEIWACKDTYIGV